MLITYLRSSSHGTYELCQQKFFLRYVLGLEDKVNRKAIHGTISHKALELLGKRKLAEQGGFASVNDEYGVFLLCDLTPEFCINLAFNKISADFPQFDWNTKDFKICDGYMNVALNWKDGMFSPLKKNIISVEQFFDFQVNKPWSKDFSLKGTLDLVTGVNADTLELLDWKTGEIKDWATGKEKNQESLMNDPQLRLYHYALHHLYPNIKNIFVTIFYLRFSKPFSLCYQKTDLPETERVLKNVYENIRDNKAPGLIYPDWKCDHLCRYSEADMNNASVDNYKNSSCFKIKNEILQIGIDKVTEKYRNEVAVNRYEGGGKIRE